MPRRSRLMAAALAAAIALVPASFAGSCPEDVNGDQAVNFADILQVIADWGPCLGCPSDIDGNGVVGFSDVLLVIGAWGADCGPVTDTELAGNPLAEYPYFEHVLAFNEGSPVHIAIDPGLIPRVAGATCDIYIVADQTEDQWNQNGILADVRGAPQTVVFGSTTIQSGTFELTDSEMLDGYAGTGLGVGYDLVCDLNQNGVLDGGDIADGFGDVAGFYVVHDITLPGPLPVTEITYSVAPGSVTAGFEGENTFYPSGLALMGQVPLVVVSHGNGHNYQWYDHIGNHLASYGYVVMSHANNTSPGSDSASITTLEHTDAFLDQLGTIAGGILANHIDTSRITWIGHSRGGEGVVRAYDRIVDGDWIPVHYDQDDIVLISSIAPVDFLGPAQTAPHGVTFSLWTGGADDDVNGCASCNLCQTFHLHDRAENWRQSISLHGVGHGDFHNGGGSSVATGPCLVGRANTHTIMRGYLLPLVKHYVEGNVPARDFLWRQWESFHPIGAPLDSCVVVDLMFREAGEDVRVIDDYQTFFSASTNSSGGANTFSVTGVVEDRLDDSDVAFTNEPTDPMNGMTVGGSGDDTRGVVFEWEGDAFYQLALVPGSRDLSDYTYLSFRAAQATRSLETIAELGDLVFTVTLVDGALTTSSISIGAYGGGIEEPYQRAGCGTGNGWDNEFETIRIRLTDFLHNGSGLDLADVHAIRLEFGPSYGSAVGRIGLDDVMVSRDPAPPRTGAIAISLPEGAPSIVDPGLRTTIEVRISAFSETVVPGSPTFHYRFDDGVYQTAPLAPLGADLYEASLPAAGCADMPEFYFSAEGTITGLIQLPPAAPTDRFQTDVGMTTLAFGDDFETDTGWTTEVLGATTGAWERGVPVDDPGWEFDPPADSDGSGSCYLTQNAVGNTDVDSGAVRLISPTLDLTDDGAVLSYDYYLALTNTDGTDRMLVEIDANDGAGPWTQIALHDSDGGTNWRSHQVTAAEIEAAGVVRTSTMRIRVTVNDGDPQSIVEAGFDAFAITFVECTE